MTPIVAQIFPGIDVGALLKDLSPSVIAMVMLYLVLRAYAKSEAERTALIHKQIAEREKSFADAMQARETTFREVLQIAEAREQRRDLLISERIQPLSAHVANFVTVTAQLFQDAAHTRGALKSQTESMTAGAEALRLASEQLTGVAGLLKGWRDEDLVYRADIVNPIAEAIKSNPAISQQIGGILERLRDLEQAARPSTQPKKDKE